MRQHQKCASHYYDSLIDEFADMEEEVEEEVVEGYYEEEEEMGQLRGYDIIEYGSRIMILWIDIVFF